MRGVWRAVFLPLVVCALVAADASAADAQVLRGRIADRGTGESIQGAFVSLVDADGVRRASTLTDARGEFILRAPAPGRYRLRAERIGFETVTTDPYELGEGETVRRELGVPSAAVELEGISVSAERQCDVHPSEGGAMARLWDEIQKAVAVAEWVEESGVLRYRIRRYTRVLEAEDLRVLRESSRQRSGYAEQPFVAPDESSLLADGYVQERDGEVFYYAPDVRTLLSDGFTRTHCFGVVQPDDDEHAGRVGLSFTPVDGRDVPDIRGTLWVDASSAELRGLEFSYTGLDGVRRSRRLGGHVDFRSLETGAWIVDDWSIRMPVVGRRQQWWVESGDRSREVLVEIREVGGEVVDLTTVRSDLDLDLAGRRGSLEGVVWDSVRAAPVPGARVFLSGTGHYTRTDAEGRFALPGVPAGAYELGFYHERATERGVRLPPRDVEVRPGEVAELRLGLPSEATMAASACAEERDAAGADDAILAGTVVDDLTLSPVAGATVRVRGASGAGDPAAAGEPGSRGWSATAETGPRGRFRFCGLPIRDSVRVDASFLGRSSADEAPLDRAEPAILHLRLGLTEPAGVRVEVVDGESGAPLEGAAVRLGGIDRTETTDGSGRASFASVPPGHRELRVEHPRRGTLRDSVLVRTAGAIRIRVPLGSGQAPAARPDVAVEERFGRGGERPGPAAASGGRRTVLDRSELGELLRSGADGPEGLLRAAELPGVRVTALRAPDGPRRLCVEPLRRRDAGVSCDFLAVFVDGLRPAEPGRRLLELQPADLERIEYLPPREAAAIYGTGARNGMLLVYTARGSGS